MEPDLPAIMRNAFPPQPLSPTILVDPTGLWDSYGQTDSFEAALKGQSWDALGTRFVEPHSGALRYLAPAAFVAFVPAYLAALLEGDTENELPAFVFSQLTRKEMWKEKFDARASRLNEAQRKVIVLVLESLERGDRFSDYRSEISEALSSWRGTLSPSAQS